MKTMNVIAFVITCFVGLCLFQPIKVEATFPGYVGKVFYSSNLDGSFDIYSFDYESRISKKINGNSSADDSSVTVSPDGEHLLFNSNRDGSYEIYTMSVNGDNLQKITNLPTSTEARPAYFPNGDKIVFRSDKDGDRELYSMDLDGTDLRRLTYSSGSDSSAKVSPKGNQIVFESNRDGHEEIYIMDINGNNQTRLTNSGGQPNIGPNWSPDGSMIVFSSRRDDGDAEIYIMNADGSSQQRITTLPKGDIEPVFSPDGKHIVFRHHMGSDTHNLYIVEIDSGDLTQLTQNTAPSTADTGPAWQPIPNKAPKIENDSFAISVNKAGIFNVLENDSDEEVLSAANLTIKTNPKNGTATIVDGKVKYTPKSNFAGRDELTYQICDSFLLDQKCSSGVLSISVQAGEKPKTPTIYKVGTVDLNGSDTVFYTGHRPTFTGTAEPLAEIKVEIHSDPIILTTTADAEGNWSVTPDVDIPNGEHTVKIITTKDGATSDPISFVLGINVGLAETGNPLWPITLIGFVGALGVVSGKYLKKRSD